MGTEFFVPGIEKGELQGVNNAIAAAGMIIKACWITCPKWFSSIIYIAMGWVCVLVFGKLLDTLSTAAFLWLLAGGVILRQIGRGTESIFCGTEADDTKE